MASDDFKEIGHSGGTITFYFSDGGMRVQYRHAAPVPCAFFLIWALPTGIPVATIEMGGIGDIGGPPPIPGCFQVVVASDSQGKFGHNCPRCHQYWRSEPLPSVCPYCGLHAAGHNFLSNAQRRYVAKYCELIVQSLDQDLGEVSINMDEVAGAVDKEGEKPAFYVSEESQQHKYTCAACGAFNDILGKFGYCANCGMRNDRQIFSSLTMPAVRDRLNSGAAGGDCVRDAVASFDTLAAQYGKQLAARVPMTKARRERLREQSYHKISEVSRAFKEWFDIDICASLSSRQIDDAQRMFYRRHVYEHNGGEVTQRYIDESGDTTVRLKEHITESQAAVHDLIGVLLIMARNLHGGFHEILPPLAKPIAIFQERQERIKKFQGA